MVCNIREEKRRKLILSVTRLIRAILFTGLTINTLIKDDKIKTEMQMVSCPLVTEILLPGLCFRFLTVHDSYFVPDTL